MFCVATAAAIAIVVVAVAYCLLDWALHSLKVGKIAGKYVFITGCDSGFGHLAAVQFDTLGFHVFAGCLTKEGAKSVIKSCSSRLTTVDLDVRSTDSIQQAVQMVKSKLPPDTGLWALINNAGIAGLFAPAELCSKEAVLETLNVNLLGAIDTTRHFLPLIRKSKGRIVNTTSVAGRLACAPIPYTTSKFAMEGYSDQLRREVRSQGIKVSIVEPGNFRTLIVNTEKMVREVQEAYDRCSPDVHAAYGGSQLMEKVLQRGILIKTTGSQDLGLVVNAYIHAVTSQFPRIRYPVGTDAKLFFTPLTYLPDGIVDFILAYKHV